MSSNLHGRTAVQQVPQLTAAENARILAFEGSTVNSTSLIPAPVSAPAPPPAPQPAWHLRVPNRSVLNNAGLFIANKLVLVTFCATGFNKLSTITIISTVDTNQKRSGPTGILSPSTRRVPRHILTHNTLHSSHTRSRCSLASTLRLWSIFQCSTGTCLPMALKPMGG